MQAKLTQKHVESTVLEICAVLKNNGYNEVNMGALLLLIGLSLEDAEPMLEHYMVIESSDDIASIFVDASDSIH